MDSEAITLEQLLEGIDVNDPQYLAELAIYDITHILDLADLGTQGEDNDVKDIVKQAKDNGSDAGPKAKAMLTRAVLVCRAARTVLDRGRGVVIDSDQFLKCMDVASSNPTLLYDYFNAINDCYDDDEARQISVGTLFTSKESYDNEHESLGSLRLTPTKTKPRYETNNPKKSSRSSLEQLFSEGQLGKIFNDTQLDLPSFNGTIDDFLHFDEAFKSAMELVGALHILEEGPNTADREEVEKDLQIYRMLLKAVSTEASERENDTLSDELASIRVTSKVKVGHRAWMRLQRIYNSADQQRHHLMRLQNSHDELNISTVTNFGELTRKHRLITVKLHTLGRTEQWDDKVLLSHNLLGKIGKSAEAQVVRQLCEALLEDAPMIDQDNDTQEEVDAKKERLLSLYERVCDRVGRLDQTTISSSSSARAYGTAGIQLLEQMEQQICSLTAEVSNLRGGTKQYCWWFQTTRGCNRTHCRFLHETDPNGVTGPQRRSRGGRRGNTRNDAHEPVDVRL
jgi:hypothetical protein